MKRQTLFVFATITPKPEYFSNAKNAILSIIKATMSESGCRQFDLFEGVDGSTLHLSEEWESEEALQEHYSKDYSVEVFENYKDWLSVPVEVLKMYQCSE